MIRDNKCLLFWTAKLGGNLLHSNRPLIQLAFIFSTCQQREALLSNPKWRYNTGWGRKRQGWSTIWPTVRGEGIMCHDVLVCQSCHNRAPQTGNLLIPSYGGWGRFLLRSVREGLFQGILSGLQMTVFSLRLLTRSSFCVCLSLCANFSFSQGYQSYWIGTQQITSF